MAELSLSNIVKRFGGFEIIHGANLEVKDGEFVVFVGPPAAASPRCSG